MSRWAPTLQSVLRIVAGFMFLAHGTQKLWGFPPSGQPHQPLTLLSVMGVGAVLEGLGGLLMMLGLFTRPVAFILAGEMAVAYFMAHAPHGFWPIINHGELAVLYCFVWLFFAAAGPGPWSLDARSRRRTP